MIAFRINRIIPALPSFRQIHLTSVKYAAESSPLFKLRKQTGIAYNLCREALNKHNNDLVEAEAWLKAQALAHGLQKATKVRARTALEGQVGLAINQNNKLATLVELNCETDFVAKNQTFTDLTLDLTSQVAAIQDNCDIDDLPGQEVIKKLNLNEQQIKRLDDQIVPWISKLGENIKIRRASHFKVTNEGSVQIFGQIHAKSGQKDGDNLLIRSGRFGAIVALKNLANEGRSLEKFGNRLCQHVIGFSPSYIELPENIRKHLEAAEKEQLEKLRHQQEAMREQRAEEGESQSDYEDNEDEVNSRDDWPSIMDQKIIMSDEITVRDFCKQNNLSIVFFDRFEAGIE